MKLKLKKPYRRTPVSVRFVEEVLERAHAVWPDDGNINEKWSAFHTLLTEFAATVLGYDEKHQPDWFRESFDALKQFFHQRNVLYTTWLATSKEEDYVKFKQARGEARRAIRKAKNDWFVAKATEVERGTFGGVEV